MDIKTLILAGGLGTRLSEETVTKPKPMVEINGMPIIQHLINIFTHQDFNHFLLALGYKREILEEWAISYANESGNTVSGKPSKIIINTLDTGRDTQTGGRIKRSFLHLNDERLIVTYGDGLANIELKKLFEFHMNHGKLATVTAVRPPARFGHLRIEGEKVTHFGEKNQSDEGWINGGFFVLEREVAKYILSDDEPFETGALPRLALEGQLMAYHHYGFWKPMDALRDKIDLEQLAKKDNIPWMSFENYDK